MTIEKEPEYKIPDDAENTEKQNEKGKVISIERIDTNTKLLQSIDKKLDMLLAVQVEKEE